METPETSLQIHTAALSRKRKRRRKNEGTSPSSAPHPETENNISLKPKRTTIRTNPSPPPPSMTTRQLFVASLGNPAPYASTLHSAGHILLSTLHQTLLYPPFTKSRLYANGLVSHPPNPSTHPYTLYQSPSLMNISGKPISTAYRSFLSSLPSSPDERSTAHLVIVHDELEVAVGKIKVKRGGSARGHNGIKSCVEALGGKQPFLRVGVGIGRPVGRGAEEVAAYVLRKMSKEERQGVEACVGELLRVLREESGG